MSKGKFLKIVIMLSMIVSLAISCSHIGDTREGAKYYNNGNYYEAVLKLSSALQVKPDFKKALILIDQAYKMSIKAEIGVIQNKENSNEKFKWDVIVTHYTRLATLQNVVSSLPDLYTVETYNKINFVIVDYSSDSKFASGYAAEEHYQEGKKFLQNSEDRDSQKSAAKEFQKASGFVPGYKDAEALYDEARAAGMVRMIVVFQDRSGASVKGVSVGDLIQDKILSTVLGAKGATEFLEIVQHDEVGSVLDGSGMEYDDIFGDSSSNELGGANEILFGKITSIIYSKPETTSQVYVQSKTINVSVKYINNDGNESTKIVAKEIAVEVIEFRMKASALISGSYKIIDVKTGKVKQIKSIKEQKVFDVSWARVFSGDEEALDYTAETLCNKDEPREPKKSDMITPLAEKIGRQCGDFLIEYAK